MKEYHLHQDTETTHIIFNYLPTDKQYYEQFIQLNPNGNLVGGLLYDIVEEHLLDNWLAWGIDKTGELKALNMHLLSESHAKVDWNCHRFDRFKPVV